MNADLPPDLLRAFVAVAETGSFTRAGERLGRVQSAVSMQVRRLEEIVGQRLFTRAARATRLTPEGEMLLGHARRLLALGASVLAELRGEPAAGPLRLGVSDVATLMLPGLLERLGRSRPHLRVEVRCDRSWNLLDALDAGDLDLAMVTQHTGRADARLLRREPLVWAVAPGRRPHAEDPLPLSLFAPGCIYRDAALAALDAAGRPWRIACDSLNIAALDAAVAAGLAVGVMPQSRLGTDFRRPDAGDDAAGLPPLPSIEVTLHARAGDGPAGRLLGDLLGGG